MAKTTTITLRESIVGHKGPITELVLRPPTLPEYMAIGDPVTVVPGDNGKNAVVDNDTAIAAYSQVCIVEPNDKNLLQQVQLADAMDVKDAIIDFFAEARQARRSPNSPTS